MRGTVPACAFDLGGNRRSLLRLSIPHARGLTDPEKALHTLFQLNAGVWSARPLNPDLPKERKHGIGFQ